MRARRPIAFCLAMVAALSLVPAAAVAADAPRVDQRYAISARLDVAAGRLDAIVDLELTNRSATAMGSVDLSLVPRGLGYVVDEGPVTVDGTEVEATWTTSINLRVPLGALEPRAVARVHVPFTLAVGRSPDAFTARTSRENGVLSFGQWFPIVSTEHDIYALGDPQVSFTADDIRLELTTTAALPRDAVACPGLIEAPEASGTHWVCEAADVRDFSFVVNPRFGLTERDVDGTVVRVYTETVDGSATADLATDAIRRLGGMYGAYAWPDLVLAEVGSDGGFSMEYPRMIHLTRGKVADPYVVYHEVAHQWFYAQVGNDQQLEPWLDEGFADFSARRLMGIGENQCSERPVDSEVFAWPAGATTGGDWTSCDGYFHAVFYRATELLTAVRSTMGGEAFDAALQSWVARHRFGFVTQPQLLRHLQARTDADLGPIFAAFLTDAEVERFSPALELRRPT
jgi:hypothetical protein